MSGRHRLLFWKEKLTVSVIYPLILNIFKKLILPCPFNNLGCLISSTTELHVSLIYTWIWSPYEIRDLQLFFFHSIGCHYILLMTSFNMQKILSLMQSQYLLFQLLPLLLMTDLFELLVFQNAILYQLFNLPLSSLILTKRHKLAEWIQKQYPYICCLQEAHFSPRDSYRLKVRGWKKIFHANGNQK